LADPKWEPIKREFFVASCWNASHGEGRGDAGENRAIYTFHVERFGYLLGKKKSVTDGTLLDRSLILCGSGISDGHTHDHSELPILLAGWGNGMVKPAGPSAASERLR
jgi:hypothetical protein